MSGRIYEKNIARIAHEVQKSYCNALGKWDYPSWEEAPEWQKESAIHGVMKCINADCNIQPSDIHDEWVHHKWRDGWRYGEVKDPENKRHPCLVPYEELPLEERIKDKLFIDTVKACLGGK